jgi:hypothetical protein
MPYYIATWIKFIYYNFLILILPLLFWFISLLIIGNFNNNVKIYITLFSRKKFNIHTNYQIKQLLLQGIPIDFSTTFYKARLLRLNVDNISDTSQLLIKGQSISMDSKVVFTGEARDRIIKLNGGSPLVDIKIETW